MQTITETKYLLEWPNGNGEFVGIDDNSGGYPYHTTVGNAHDFKSPEKSAEYQRHFRTLIQRKVTITYSVE